MSSQSPITRYLSARWELLAPIVSHGIEAVSIAVVVHATSLMLRFLLPHEYAVAIEEIELLFYLALSATLCLYTFIVFCITLTTHLFQHASERLLKGLGIQLLPPPRDQDWYDERQTNRERHLVE
jgi:hypothetical protein